eukprot:scaffold56520_cov51-Phaeocystis_antarctica.AAC.6
MSRRRRLGRERRAPSAPCPTLGPCAAACRARSPGASSPPSPRPFAPARPTHHPPAPVPCCPRGGRRRGASRGAVRPPGANRPSPSPPMSAARVGARRSGEGGAVWCAPGEGEGEGEERGARGKDEGRCARKTSCKRQGAAA